MKNNIGATIEADKTDFMDIFFIIIGDTRTIDTYARYTKIIDPYMPRYMSLTSCDNKTTKTDKYLLGIKQPAKITNAIVGVKLGISVINLDSIKNTNNNIIDK